MVITLIGMPGSGKSCMGRGIAGKLKMKLIDVDTVIEERTGKPLHYLIETFGTDEFRRIEEEALLSITEDNVIISTGGSAVYHDKAMQYYKSRGKLIYLYADIDVLKERLGDFSKRGILFSPGQTFEDLYRERCVLYEKYADLTVDCNGKAYGKYRATLIKKVKELLESASEK